MSSGSCGKPLVSVQVKPSRMSHSGVPTSSLEIRMRILSILKALTATAALALACGHASAQDKVLKVGSTPTGVPFTFLDTKTNTIQGIMVDLIREVAKDAGLKVEVEGMPFATLIPSLTGNKIDIIAAAMYITPPRLEVINFSNPIYTYGEGLIVPKKDTKAYAKPAPMRPAFTSARMAGMLS